jgi:hypothetical protein
MQKPVTRLDACQYLLVSQINYTRTNFADHCEQCSHDAINRSLRGERITPRLVWANVHGQVVLPPYGYVMFADTVLDKNSSLAIALVRAQYSGNAKAVITGLGVVTCGYVHPAPDQFWLLDYRVYDPDGDGKSKLDPMREMLTNVVYQKQLPLQAVLMDTWYATKDLRLFIESLHHVYDCPLKDNRQVEDIGGECASQRVDALEWSADALAHGKRIKSKGFPTDHKVHLFRVEVSPHRTDDVVPNGQAQDATEATQEAYGFRWKIEPRHCEGTQVTGLERCQCHTARIQRHPIGCAFLVCVRLRSGREWTSGRLSLPGSSPTSCPMWESSPLPERVAWMLQPWGSAHGVASGAVQPSQKRHCRKWDTPRRGASSQRIGIERLDATLRLAWEHSP